MAKQIEIFSPNDPFLKKLARESAIVNGVRLYKSSKEDEKRVKALQEHITELNSFGTIAKNLLTKLDENSEGINELEKEFYFSGRKYSIYIKRID